MKKKEQSKFGIINLIALCVLVLILSCVPTLKIVAKADDFVEQNFVEEGSSLQGILEIWNIDTFEAGTFSKESFLLEVAKEFQNLNKGTYVLVRNMSVEEMNLELEGGKTPDLFSFGFGLGNVLSEYLAPVKINGGDKFGSVQDSGLKNEERLAVAYLLGGYFLFSTGENLLNANISAESVDLTQYVNSAGYVKKLRKGEKQVYSMSFGCNDFVSPLNALGSVEVDPSNTLKLDNDFEAYQSFVSLNTSTILLGTQRSLARFENKVKLGQLDSFICNPLSPYCDLVQYLGVSKNATDIKKEYAQKFVDLTLNESMQEKVLGIGMLPVSAIADWEAVSASPQLMALYGKYEEEIIVPKLFS